MMSTYGVPGNTLSDIHIPHFGLPFFGSASDTAFTQGWRLCHVVGSSGHGKYIYSQRCMLCHSMLISCAL
jgi:hypothetical protein